MIKKIKWLLSRKRVEDLIELVMDFFKKCNDDHVAAFGAMSAFFILLSLFPFLIFLLTLTKYAPFSKQDIENVLLEFISFEKNSIIISLLDEIYSKTATSVFTVSIVAALWASSKGVYSIVKGMNSVYDIDDTRNYFVVRIFSLFYTLAFAIIISGMMVLWVFGNALYDYICMHFPVFAAIASYFIHKRIVLTCVLLTLIFMLIYQFIPRREVRFLNQLPGAIIAMAGWIAVSRVCALYMDNFSNFTYFYGSMAGIMILLIWMYFCMTMIFYGAEINFFLDNKKNYHKLIRIIRPKWRDDRRKQEKEMKEHGR